MKLLPPLMLLLVWAFLNPNIFAQDLFSEGSRSESLAGATSGIVDFWSVFGNQAGLADTKSVVVGGSFQNKFLVRELSSRSGFITVPVQSSVFAFSIAQFGHIPFRQEKYGITYARQLSPHFNFGLQFNTYRVFLSEENQSAGTYGAEIGVQYLRSRKLVVGLHLVNPYQTKIKLNGGDFHLESRIRLGTFYKLSDVLSLAGELENHFDGCLKSKIGMEYWVLDKLAIRGGISGKPYTLSGGLGFKLKKLIVDQAFCYTRYLGYSPSVSFQYQF